MAGETNLNMLLKDMQPLLQEGVYVFHSSDKPFESLTYLGPVLIFKEEEGTALILRQETAEQAGLDYAYPSRMITLNVHSSLDAVGFLAAITEKLAKAGISVNPVSAHYHDHLFVPVKKAEQAMKILKQFSKV